MPATGSQVVEWKQSWRDEYLRWLCAFANADGGTLVIGKNDRGEVVGLADARRLQDEIPNKIRDLLGVVADVRLCSHGSVQYLEISVGAYPHPISYRGEYHVRSGSTRQELKGAALHAFLLRKAGRRWDAVPIPGVSVADFDPAALRVFRTKAARSGRVHDDVLNNGNDTLIERLHLRERALLKRAAVLLFHPDPQQFVTGACVKIGRFDRSGELMHHDIEEGPVFLQPDRCLELLTTKYLTAAVTFEGLQRVERWPVPLVALREALLNAVAHKDYSSGVAIQLRVTDAGIWLWNTAVLPDGWTADTLRTPHASLPHNPDMANAFFRAGMVEAWGSGYQRMSAACRTARGDSRCKQGRLRTAIRKPTPFRPPRPAGPSGNSAIVTVRRCFRRVNHRISVQRADPPRPAPASASAPPAPSTPTTKSRPLSCAGPSFRALRRPIQPDRVVHAVELLARHLIDLVVKRPRRPANSDDVVAITVAGLSPLTDMAQDLLHL